MTNELEQAFQPPPIGHNQPPSETELLAAKLAEETLDLDSRYKALMSGLSRLPEKIETAEWSKKVTTYAAQLQDCIAKMEEERVARKRPFDELAKIVHNFFKSKQDEMTAAVVKAKGLLKGWDEIERKRIAGEEAKRRAEETRQAEAKAAEAKRLADAAAALEQAGMTQAAEKTMEQAGQVESAALQQAAAASAPAAPIKAIHRGTAGGSASSRGKWDSKIVDVENLDVGPLLPFISRVELEKALRGWTALKTKQLKEGDTPPVLKGAEVFWDRAITIRR